MKDNTNIDEWEDKSYNDIDPIILINKIRTPDGTILISRHDHDYVVYKDKNGYSYMVDGGLSYLRRAFVEYEPYEELSVYSTDSFEKIRESFEWGSYGKSGKEQLKYIALSNMTDEHIKAILKTQRLSNLISSLFKKELLYRKKLNK